MACGAVAVAGRMARVLVGGRRWTAFDAKAETVDFAPASLTEDLLRAMQDIVAEWDA